MELTPRSLLDPYAKSTPFVRFGAGQANELSSSKLGNSGIGFCDLLFEVPALRGIKVDQVVAGDRASYVRTDGRVLGWGANEYGQLALGSTFATDCIPVPSEIVLSRGYPAGTSVKCVDLAAGGDMAYFAVEAKSPQDVACKVDLLAAGMGQFGTLGHGSYCQAQGSPVKVKNVSGIMEYNEATKSIQPLRIHSISVSPAPQCGHTILALATGVCSLDSLETHAVGHDVLSFGFNADYQLGNGKRSSLPIPTHVSALGALQGRMMLRTKKGVPLVDLRGKSRGRGVVEETGLAGWSTSAVYWKIQ